MQKRSHAGFTLLEVLVVVLIIGILAAVALPQYQKAVLKSRFTAMMLVAKTIADANEVYYAEHGEYATAPGSLNVTVQAEAPDGTSVLMYTNPEDLSFVRVKNETGVPNAQYVVYQKLSKNFPDTTWCEARDTRAEEVCIALGGVIPTGVTGNSAGQDDWKAYLLSGQTREGDSFAVPGGCSGSAPANVTASQSGATGTATCVNGQWKYEWTGGTTYSAEEEICTGDSAYACAGSTFSGNYSVCGGDAENGCAGSTFSGRMSQCDGYAANACAGSTFSGERSGCTGRAANAANAANACAGSTFTGYESSCWGEAENACAGSTFSGEGSGCGGEAENACAGSTFSGNYSVCGGDVENGCAGNTFSGEGSYCRGNAANGCAGNTFSGDKSFCRGEAANACAGSTFQAGSWCYANRAGACDNVTYTTHPDKGNTLTGCCTGKYCPAGSPKCGDWNDTTHAYNINGTW